MSNSIKLTWTCPACGKTHVADEFPTQACECLFEDIDPGDNAKVKMPTASMDFILEHLEPKVSNPEYSVIIKPSTFAYVDDNADAEEEFQRVCGIAAKIINQYPDFTAHALETAINAAVSAFGYTAVIVEHSSVKLEIVDDDDE